MASSIAPDLTALPATQARQRIGKLTRRRASRLLMGSVEMVDLNCVEYLLEGAAPKYNAVRPLDLDRCLSAIYMLLERPDWPSV